MLSMCMTILDNHAVTSQLIRRWVGRVPEENSSTYLVCMDVGGGGGFFCLFLFLVCVWICFLFVFFFKGLMACLLKSNGRSQC